MSRASGPDHYNWSEVPRYIAVHLRLRAQNGPASQEQCVNCDAQAQHWAYDHTDPDEHTEDGMPYSLDLERYQPMCVRCHRRLDRSFVTHCKHKHEFTEANTWVRSNGVRQCRKCNADRQKKTRQRKKERRQSVG